MHTTTSRRRDLDKIKLSLDLHLSLGWKGADKTETHQKGVKE